MKIKEIDRTANVAWSPAQQFPIYLAAGTAAQQVDSSFSTNSLLELYLCDVTSPDLDIPIAAAVPCESRFHKLVWGCHGFGGGSKASLTSGVIVGGFDGGLMNVYDASKILHKHENPLVLTKNKHTGPVRALDFNCFRPYLIASGATDSEIFIWDLNNPKTPMSPGSRSQPHDDVTSLAWNKQVEHILASTFSSRCAVWDLRKNEPIIKLADAATKIKYKVVEWHPTAPTQMCLASEDDTNPVIQLWDLRYATAPLKVLQGHERGVLDLSWCQRDPDLLLSCGKDSHIYCWNPNIPYAGYELVCDIHTSSQWSFGVSFSPRNPLLISTSSFDGRVDIFSLSGGNQPPVSSAKLADSFPGMNMDFAHAPVPSQKPVPLNLRDAPKWLKRPCGASFAFGGKLVTFSNLKHDQHGSGDSHDKHIVSIKQVITLPEFVAKSQKFEDALQNGTFGQFCEEKAYHTKDDTEARVWQFLRASFSASPSDEYLRLLGFEINEVQLTLGKFAEKMSNESVDSIMEGFVSLGDVSGHSNHLLPSNNGKFFENVSQASTRSVTPEPGKLFSIPTDESAEGLLNQALLCANIECAVDLCLKDGRWADALILASLGSPELVKKAQLKYFHKCQSETSNMIRAVVTRDLKRLVERCELESWAQALATALNYANDSEFPTLAEILGRRLENSKVERLKKNALLCYICCGDMSRLMEGWVSDCIETTSPETLQNLIEQVILLKKASEFRGRGSLVTSKTLVSKLVQYATLLASQGCLEAALNYVKDTDEPSMVILRETISYSLGLARNNRPSNYQSQPSPYFPSSQPVLQPASVGTSYFPSYQPASVGTSSVYPPSETIRDRKASAGDFATTTTHGNFSGYTTPGPLTTLPPVAPGPPRTAWNDPPPLGGMNYPPNQPYFPSSQPILQPAPLSPVRASSVYNPNEAIKDRKASLGDFATISRRSSSGSTAQGPVPLTPLHPIDTALPKPAWNDPAPMLGGMIYPPSQPSPYFPSSQPILQPAPVPSVAASSIYNPNEAIKDMKASIGDFTTTSRGTLSGCTTPAPAPSTPLLPAGIAPPKTAWNDPPMLKNNLTSKPKFQRRNHF